MNNFSDATWSVEPKKGIQKFKGDHQGRQLFQEKEFFSDSMLGWSWNFAGSLRKIASALKFVQILTIGSGLPQAGVTNFIKKKSLYS